MNTPGLGSLRAGLLAALIPALAALAAPAAAGDWPMWRYDAGHTAAAPDDLPAELQLHWTRNDLPRVPVWDDPLNQDMMPYDRIFEPVVAGGRMFLSFNDTDKVLALDVRDGSEIWSFYTDGPVRFSPAVYQDLVLFTSDDGYLYCVGASDGELRWRFRGGPSERKVIGNSRVISTWPARGGPVVADGTVYFAASIWPFMGTFVYALDARTGEVQWLNDETADHYQKQPHAAPSFGGVAPQGQLTVAGELLLVPGGRSLPAGFDRATGELRFFDFGGKGQGGSFVAAEPSRVFVHTRLRGAMALRLPGGGDAKFQVNEPVLAGGTLYTAAAAEQTKDAALPPRVQAYDAKNKLLWQFEADGSGDLIQAGNRLYAAGGEKITAIDLPSSVEPARLAWTQQVDGEVCRLLAASERLFAVTLDGRILAFGGEPEPASVPPATILAAAPPVPSGEASPAAIRLLEAAGKRDGYALWFGVDDEDALEAVAAASELHIVGIDPDVEKIARLRRRWDRAGLYGRRIALHVGTPQTYLAPQYMADLVVVGRSLATMLTDSEQLGRVYESVRPYGGKLWIQIGDQQQAAWADQLAIAGLPGAQRTMIPGAMILSREGPLPGAGQWTHAYGDVANTVKSNDQRVKLPLGLLWFGGSSNEDVLPRHGHGPSQQVLGGRLFIQGMHCLSARDVYTGRILWKREFEDLDTFQVYYDESYAPTPLSTSYNQLHLPGANARGTNYVAAEEGVYLVLRERCVLLDAADGQTLREFRLPPGEQGHAPQWGYIGVYGDLLLAGAGFADYTGRLNYSYTPEAKRGVAWGPDRSASLGLVAFDRHSGELVWQIEAEHSFLHNGIVAGGGRIYLLDKLPKRVEEHNRRRGTDAPATYRLLAIDAQTGTPVWTLGEPVFGTWLSYSEEHDLLLQAGAAASGRSPDEVDRGLTVHRAGDGSIVWSNPSLSYAGPCILHGATLITNTTSYRESKGAFSLLDGSPITVADPVTGEAVPWRFTRTYGCNTAVASEHLLTFRSGAAGFYDLANHGGTGNLGGFKSGCSSNLIAADGVLNAPEYTRTCSCAYQNQTSLALVPMPDNELWTYSLFGQRGGKPLAAQRIGVNFGAPGDRLSEDGTWWVNYPPNEAFSPDIDVQVEGPVHWFRTHSAWLSGGELPWVAASGVQGAQRVTVHLLPRSEDPVITVAITDSKDDAEEADSGQVNLTSSDLELTQDGSLQTVGLRFPKIPLARGAKIKRAYVQFHVDEASAEPTVLEIRGQAADDAPAFSTEAFDITRRLNTASAAPWEPKAWTANSTPGADHQTSDLSAVVQEIVDRAGWKSGNALVLIIRGSGKRVAASADGDQKKAPKLVLETEPNSASPVAESAAKRRYTVRLHFREPAAERQPGERVFDVAFQGEVVTSGLDVAAQAGGALRPIVRTWQDIPAAGALEISLIPRTELPPVISGVEIIQQDPEP